MQRLILSIVVVFAIACLSLASPARAQSNGSEYSNHGNAIPTDGGQPMPHGDAAPLGLDGYCPVQLTEAQTWTRGDPRWGAVHDGRTYLFAGPDQQRRFLADPLHYAPVNRGNDVVWMVEGRQMVAGNREYGAFYGGHLYLFASDQTRQRFVKNQEFYARQALQSPWTAAGPSAAPQGNGMAPAVEKEVRFDLGRGVWLEMVLIPPGEFVMGSPDSDKSAISREKPQHRVRITKPFYLGKFPVTQEQWEAVSGNSPSFIKGPTNPSHFQGPKRPVERVNWDDCQVFLSKLNEKTGGQGSKFALPTEAQWEYACRAGSTTRYCFGDKESGLGEYAWYKTPFGLETHPVGEKKPNGWGLYDMHGNVWEWCQDWFDDGYYARSPVDDPTGPPAGSRHVIRGGGWLKGGNGVDRDGGWGNLAGSCRSANRNRLQASYRIVNLGFRVARVPADK